MEIDFKLSEKYPANLRHIWDKTHKKLLYIDARSGGKSYTMKYECVFSLINNPNKDVVVVRKNQNTLRDSVGNEILDAIDELGLNAYFEWTPSLLRFRYIPNDNYIYLKAIDDDNFKGFRPKSGTYSLVWVEETQQLKSKEELDTITNTTMKYSDEDTLNVFTGNGKNERNHWVNKWKDKCKTIPGYGVYRHTYLDVEHLLPKHLLDEINLIKEYDYAQYRVEYLGEYGMSASSIYKKFNYDDVAIEEIDNNDINVILGGCDYGDSDAFVCTASGISANFDKVQVIDTFYHKNGVSPMMKDVNDYVKDFFDFYEEISLKYNKRIRVEIDSASLSFIKVARSYQAQNGGRYKDIIIEGTNKKRKISKYGYIESRIVLTNLLIGAGRLNVNKKCTQLLEAFELAQYNNKGERVDNGTSDIDSLDSFEYSILYVLETLYNATLNRKGE